MILFYAHHKDRVVETLEEMLAEHKFESFRSVSSLAKRLCKPCHGLAIALLIVRDSEEMIRIAEIQNLIRDLRLVLVLPGHDPEMVSLAHSLVPRFIAYADNGFEQAAAVVCKMANQLLRAQCV
jgi:phosphohistidine phosphatase SixA